MRFFFQLQLFFPFLVLITLRMPRMQASWFAAAIGLYFDLLASDFYLGFRALLFVVTLSVLYPCKRFVFEEKCIPFVIYATLFGVLYTLLLSLIYTIAPPYFTWSWQFIFSDLLFLPFCEAWFGWIIFILPQRILLFFRQFALR